MVFPDEFPSWLFLMSFPRGFLSLTFFRNTVSSEGPVDLGAGYFEASAVVYNDVRVLPEGLLGELAAENIVNLLVAVAAGGFKTSASFFLIAVNIPHCVNIFTVSALDEKGGLDDEEIKHTGFILFRKRTQYILFDRGMHQLIDFV